MALSFMSFLPTKSANTFMLPIITLQHQQSIHKHIKKSKGHQLFFILLSLPCEPCGKHTTYSYA